MGITVLGLLSDSHGRRARTARAVELLHGAGATTLVHLGDLEDASLLEELMLPGVEVHVVPGNMDDPRELAAVARSLGASFHDPGGTIRLGERTISFTHGHDRELARLLAARPDYLLHGHTHVAADREVDGVRVINPGALHRAARFEVALLEPRSGRLDRLVVPA